MFKELKTPEQGMMGWYMHVVENSAGWLTTYGTYSASVADTSIFYFDTELEILEKAFQYYFSHGELFPFTDRLVELQRQSPAVHTPTIKQSRTMEFV